MPASSLSKVKCFFNERRTQKVCTVLGACFLLAPLTINYIWGNLSIYVLSYIHKQSPSVSGTQASWVSSLYLMMQGVAIFPAGPLIQKAGQRVTAMLGVIAFNIGSFGGYFAVRRSIFLVNLTQGALVGVGGGLLLASGTKYGIQWSGEKDAGTIMGILLNAYTVAAIPVNQFITWYINPLNQLPDTVSGDFTFFSQPDILERVPAVFLIIGTFFLVLQIVGLLLVRDGPSSPPSSFSPPSLSSLTSQGDVIDLNEESTLTQKKMPGYSENGSDSSLSTGSETENVPDIPPRQLLRTPSFCFLWIGFLTIEFVFITMSVNYKAFGQLWINDDNFLTEIGTASAVVICVVKMVAGVAVDKIGLKYVIMFYYGAIAVCQGFMYVAAQLDQWLYFILAVLLVSLSGSAFLVHTVTTVKLYGRKHAVLNIGLLDTATIVMMAVAPFAVDLLMSVGGWPAVFFTGAVITTIGLVLVTIGIPRR